MTVTLQQSSFGRAATGEEVSLFTFSHLNGVTLTVTNYGGVIQSVCVPDRDGNFADIVLGYDTLPEYEADQKFLGCLVGRYANRIANGNFKLDGVEYQLETNPSGHHIHGGSEGFHKQLWQASIEQENEIPLLVLRYSSAHMQGGYPGNVDCKVIYSLNAAAEITVSYYAVSDRPTILNVTNHSYFNLAGHESAAEGGILDHLMQVNSDAFLPTDALGIPVSGPVPVADTPMDFRKETAIAAGINTDNVQLNNAGGYDHTWVVNRDGDGLAPAVCITDPVSGRMLEVLTTQPGVQCYTANHVAELCGKGGMVYRYRGAVCLETQHFPDSPNNEEFPSVIVTPDKPLHETTVFRPAVRKTTL